MARYHSNVGNGVAEAEQERITGMNAFLAASEAVGLHTPAAGESLSRSSS